MDAHPKVVNLAEALPEQAWKRQLETSVAYHIFRMSDCKSNKVK
jgi:parvulin-like peptidyl-prolyl isomerase